MAYRQPTIGSSINEFFETKNDSDMYVEYSGTGDLAHNTDYTLSFYARTIGNGAASYSTFMGVRVRDDDDNNIATYLVHVPRTWELIYLPLRRDSSLTVAGEDGLNFSLEFGLTPRARSAVSVSLDSVSVKQGIGYVGYQREFDNGLVLANVRESSVSIDMPDSVYDKIAASGNLWADGAHNDSSVVADSLTIPAEDAYFLFGSPPQDSTPPEAVTSLDTTRTAPDSVYFVFDQGDSADIAGYVMTYLPGAVAPNERASGTTVPDSSTSKTDVNIAASGLDAQTQYSFTCFAYDEVPNYSVPGAGSKFTVTTAAPAADAVKPDQVTGVDTSSVTTNAVNLFWDEGDSSDIAGYVVKWDYGTAPPPTHTDGVLGDSTTAKDDTTASITGLPENTTITASVFAFDGAGPKPNYSDTTSGSYMTVTTDGVSTVYTIIVSDRDSADYQGRWYDTHIRTGIYSTTNYGTETLLRLKTDDEPSDEWQWPYFLVNLKTVLPTDVSVDSAKLEIYVNWTGHATEKIYLYRCRDAWADSTATWDSPFGDATEWTANQGRGALIDSTNMPAAGLYMSFDVTDEVHAVSELQTTPFGYLNVTLRDFQADNMIHNLSASEHGSDPQRPQLILYYTELDDDVEESRGGFDIDQDARYPQEFIYQPPSR
jgi:hypothetical protein